MTPFLYRRLPLLLIVLLARPCLAVQDVHSYANPDAVRVRHIDLDLVVDFDRRVLSGHVDLSIERSDPSARELTLDTRDLTIRAVSIRTEENEWTPLDYEVGPAAPHLGAPLRIALPADGSVVRVEYQTSPAASGLQWLTPAQTAGKQHPFLFTQSQAIHARSWIPLQDTPQVRATYAARIRTPPELLAVMSAATDPDSPRDGDYRFEMPQAIPSYLIALGAGDLAFRSMGPRTGVYAEPGVLAAAATEFADTEKMLATAEELYGPYRWGRYDLLILPPSFPMGGMENPRLSFITPTVIAGDRSLVSLIAHELAHSWSGNLVTNATWRDLWLNEGFTTYVTWRIMEAVYGAPRAAMEAVLDYQDLEADLAALRPADQLLAVDLTGRDPDEVFSRVPYVKGALLLKRLEEAYGRSTFDAFVKRYFERFAFQSITTESFLGYLQSELMTRPAAVSRAEVDRWVHEPGLPPTAPLARSDAFTRVAEAQQRWLADDVAALELPTSAWTVHEWLYFINTLPERLEPAQLEELDEAFDLSASQNAEIAHSWFRVAIRNDYQPAFASLHGYLVHIGRRKLVKPLYEDLMKTEAGAAFARSVYAEARPGYHALTVAAIDEIVKSPTQKKEP